MCGRYLYEAEIRELFKKYKIDTKDTIRYNKGDYYPSQSAPIVLEDKRRTLELAKWGFHYNSNKGMVINARAESIMNKPMFKKSFHSSRCIIPANLFYEWKDEGNKKKVKYKIGLQDENIISLGGIYKISVDENSNKQLTFVIITTEAEGDMKEIHSRMPLIIKNDELDLWINKNTSTKLLEEILNANINYNYRIERCEDKAIGSEYDQMRMF